MAITLLDQETQVKNTAPVALYDDTVASSEANFETNPASLKDDLNNLRSSVSNLLDGHSGDWFTDLNTPATLENGTQRGVNDLNTDLHAIEKKRVIREVLSLSSMTVGVLDNWIALSASDLPAQTTAAVGAVTTLGTVVAAHGGTYGSHSVAEVAGPNAVNPLNLVHIVDSATHDAILTSGSQEIYGLLQGESGLVDGDTITAVTDNRVQISFVHIVGDDLIEVEAADIQGKTIHYTYHERVRLEDLNEYDFLHGANVDPASGTTVSRQAGYTNQGVTPVDVVTNSTLDLEGAGLFWKIRDDDEADLFVVTEGSAGGTSEVALESTVDTFRSDAIINDMDNGLSVDTGAAGTTINVGVTANQIDSGGALTVLATGNLDLDAGSLLAFGDGFEAASGFDTPLVLSDSSAEWDDFETAFGEVSLLAAITAAKNSSGRVKIYATVTVDANADADLSGPATDNNLDVELGNLSSGSFLDDYDIYLNGQLQYNGANAAANKDVYPGTALTSGQIKFEKKVKVGHIITLIDWIN